MSQQPRPTKQKSSSFSFGCLSLSFVQQHSNQCGKGFCFNQLKTERQKASCKPQCQTYQCSNRRGAKPHALAAVFAFMCQPELHRIQCWLARIHESRTNVFTQSTNSSVQVLETDAKTVIQRREAAWSGQNRHRQFDTTTWPTKWRCHQRDRRKPSVVISMLHTRFLSRWRCSEWHFCSVSGLSLCLCDFFLDSSVWNSLRLVSWPNSSSKCVCEFFWISLSRIVSRILQQVSSLWIFHGFLCLE